MSMSFWTRRKYAYLRRLLRGHAWSKRHLGFTAIRRLHNGLLNVKVVADVSGARWFFGATASKAELVVRQFVFDRYGGKRLNYALFEYLGRRVPIGTGMPTSWRSFLECNGWPMNRWLSAVAWQAMIAMRFAHGVWQILKHCIRMTLAARVSDVSGPYAYFDGLAPANLPIQGDEGESYEICTFYAKWQGRSPTIRAICHDVPNESECMAGGLSVSYRPPAYALARGLGMALRLAWWGGWATIFALLQMLLGRWHWALMLGEAANAKATRLAPPGSFAAEYLFHASRTIYRPMWTYEVEKAGAKVAVYFYSTTVQPKLANGYESQSFEWGPNTWPRFIVWDQYQEDRMRRDLGDKVEVVQAGPIYFSDSGKAIPLLPRHSIAVFDIQPHRPTAHLGISTIADCMADHPDFYHLFLSDVTDVLRECSAVAVLKTKREIDTRGDKRYGRILKRLEGTDNVRIVDPGLSAMRVAAHCCAGISAPFTSTAIHVQALGLPSAYYDPVGWVQSDDSGAHGIPILRGKEELRGWVTKVLIMEALTD
jgi:polysaccharide biosynthesis PFTS motif protein